ncbi:uncharacterized protein LOC123509606 isoform X2 [Portunus trituberculatus]|uniref:uncharacterized protein LOC123509606 isoform X2 n=1 Tax=Portunus trituberculatus TaxID=210409 RepID=UPI001E1CE706|nr:uncharacterized protein LOC123509606 isoform X2 [Portunus trituberculatus]
MGHRHLRDSPLGCPGDFKILFGVQHNEAGMWAAADITVRGMTGPPVTTTPAPPIPPQANLTTESSLNETTTTATQVNGTTLEPANVTTIATVTTTEEEDLSSLESVAQAIWDAFYVFLALFCACLVALVALIVHGRCKYVGSYPLHRESA